MHLIGGVSRLIVCGPLWLFQFSAEDIACHNVTAGVTIDPNDIVIADGRLNYNLKDRNPVDNVLFYSNSNVNGAFILPCRSSDEKERERLILTGVFTHCRVFPHPQERSQLALSRKGTQV